MKDRTILLVEDNQDDVTLTMLALKECNIVNRVTVLSDGAEALDYLLGSGTHAEREPDPLPALLLLDLNLPKIGGLEVLRRLRADPRTRRLPVVVLTSSREDRDVLDSYDLGCNSYVRKPVDFDQFIEAVRQLGLYWLLLNEPPPEIRSTP